MMLLATRVQPEQQQFLMPTVDDIYDPFWWKKNNKKETN
jgi:hypothetical protein